MSRRRIVSLAFVVLVLAGTLGVQAVLAGVGGSDGSVAAGSATDRPTPGNTLISTQGYHDDGELLEVTPAGDVVWRFDPPDSRVFDAEVLDDGNVLVSVATRRPASECPASALRVEPDECVYNQVKELDYGSQKTVWEYTWYDEFITHHEVHDADRLPNGNTAIVDMGNDRVFVVNRAGKITWEWDAEKHLAPGTDFYRTYGGDPNPGGEADWTHVNDVDLLENGNFQLSIRNFDSVIEVDRDSKRIVSVYGRPGNHSLLYEQHNPDRLADGRTILVADSENQRVLELGPDGEIGWRFGGKDLLTWPRDADRLPDRNTLITDSVNDRVIEVAPDGKIVWEYNGVSLPYNADRVGVPEDYAGPVIGTTAPGRFDDGSVLGTVDRYLSFMKFVLPAWVGVPEFVNALLLVVCGLWLVVEVLRARFRPT